MNIKNLLLTVLSILSVHTLVEAQQKYEVTEIATALSSFGARDINEQGQVVGSTLVNGEFKAVLLKPDGTLDKFIPNFEVTGILDESTATAINNNGVIVGSATGCFGTQPCELQDRAFIFSNNQLQEINVPGAVNSIAKDINDDNMVTGQAILTTFDSHMFRWDQSNGAQVIPTLGSEATGNFINSSGVVYGNLLESGVFVLAEPFAERQGVTVKLPAIPASLSSTTTQQSKPVLQALTGVNDLGITVGSARSSIVSQGSFFPANFATVGIDDELTILPGLPSAESSSAYAINNNGDIVGDSFGALFEETVIWKRSDGYRKAHSLKQLLISSQSSVYNILFTQKITNNGVILAFCENTVSLEFRSCVLRPV